MGDLNRASFLFFLIIVLINGPGSCRGAASHHAHYGRLIGSFNSGRQAHGIRGEIYAVDARTLFIKGFSYDGKARDMVFYAGSSSQTGTDGFVIPNEDGSREGLSRAYSNQDLTLTLPEGKTLKEIRWITVYNRAFSEHYGEVRIPTGFDYPRPQRLSALSGIHKVSSDKVYVVDAQTFLIPNFTYDGAAPDAFFWVGTGSKPGQVGVKVPDENGKLDILRRYDTKTLVLTLPGDLTVFDIEWLSIWCQAFGVDFGHIRIPKSLNVPPSLKMLGVAPQAKLNCEVLWDDLALEVRWAVAGETIVLQLVGKIDDGQYVAFGPSGDTKKTRMIGADVAVGWLDRSSGKGFVHDHFITSKSQCSGGKGVCQDTLSARGANNVRLLNAALVNDYVMLTYQRPLKAQDDQDKMIVTNGTQAVVWAVGTLNADNEPTYHKLRNKGDLLIDFGRSPFWNCPAPEEPSTTVSSPTSSFVPPVIVPTTEKNRQPWSTPDVSQSNVNKGTVKPQQVSPNKPPWYIPAIECYEPENHVFYAHIGPTGGSRGYNAITGRPGWGFTWFINGLLIPEVTVIRGQTYTFVVEGGQDPERPSRYHPFYITDDSEGGYEFKTPEERSRAQVYAGVVYDREGNPAPTTQGRLCEWVEDPAHPADSFSSFGAFQRTLKLHCEEGQPALLQWTVENDTPDTVYYQSYTHRYLGWKIRVVDDCDDTNHNRKSGTVLASTNRPLTDSESEPDYLFEDESSKPKSHHPGPGTIRGDQDDEEEYYQDHPTNVRRPVQQQGPPPVNRQQVDTTGKPLELLTKLLNQASPLGQQHHQQPPRQPFPVQQQQQPPRYREDDFDGEEEEDPPAYRDHQSPPNRINPSVPLRRPSGGGGGGNPIRTPFQDSDSFGFNPGTIILESGFKPIRKSDGPIPPLGFEVESQPSLSHHHQDHDDESDDSLRNHRFSQHQEPTSDRPGLITLDPVFVASEPDSSTANKVGQRGRPRDSLPVQLPKAVVPVVPGPPSSHQDLPIVAQRYPILNNPNQFNQQPPPQYRQPQPVHHQRPLPPYPQQQERVKNKPSSGLASFFNFGGNRRNQQVAQPESQPPSRNQQRRPEYLDHRNNVNAPSKPAKPEGYSAQQRLVGLLQRILLGERRKDINVPMKAVLSPAMVRNGGPAAGGARPMMTFQGALPPVIVSKVHGARPPLVLPGGPQRSDNPRLPNVLDPYSASIIGGGSVLGLPGTKASISESEKAQLERFLFGPGENMAPRSFSSEVVEFLRSEGFLDENSTDLPELLNYFTENPEDEVNTESTDVMEESTDVMVDIEKDSLPIEDGIRVPLNNNNGDDEEEESREKRQVKTNKDLQGDAADEDHNLYQHLDHYGTLNPDEIDSSKLPVEHRGLEDEHHEEHPTGSTSASSRLLLVNGPFVVFIQTLLCLSIIRKYF